MFREQTLDDLLNIVYETLKNKSFNVSPTRSAEHGNISELIGVKLHLDQPIARLSRSHNRGLIFSRIGELLWYLSGKNDLEFIKYYIPHYSRESEDGKTIHGGYGPRIFDFNGINQLENVIELLKGNEHTRRAVIQIFDANDISTKYKEIPCTCSLQFIIRERKLHLIVYMRSNDVYIGLPHDIFCFTMLQEIVARSISDSLELGEYHHHVGSLHLYKSNLAQVEKYLYEGFQSTLIQMPKMPSGDPWIGIKSLLGIEKKIRDGWWNINFIDLNDYWLDIARLLRVYYLSKAIKNGSISRESGEKKIKDIKCTHQVYNYYIQQKLQQLQNQNDGNNI